MDVDQSHGTLNVAGDGRASVERGQSYGFWDDVILSDDTIAEKLTLVGYNEAVAMG